jgi:hypothetical protein
LVTATTDAPVRPPAEDWTAASGVTAESRIGATGDGADGTGEDERGKDRNTEGRLAYGWPSLAQGCLEGGSSPYVHSTVLGVCDL